MRVVVWQASAFPGCERAALNATRGGWELAGTAVAAIGGQPIEVQYTIACDSRWRTRSAEVNVRDALGMRALCWSIDEAGLWWCGGKEIARVRGCVDVDLGISPSTNTLPIRRLDLPVGGASEVAAAWVRLPELTIEPLRQRYTRLTETTYRYESDSFSADIEVDELGLVVRYAGGWERVGVANRS